MNCKPGDLAVIVKSAAGNEGAFVDVLYSLGSDPVWRGERWCRGDGPAWLCKLKRPTRNNLGDLCTECPVPDAWLRPIRPPSQEDETETVKEMESV